MKPNLVKIERLVKSKTAITINTKLIKRILGFEDMRDFFEAVRSWGYNRDFTYQNSEYDLQRFIRLFLKETYLDS